MNAGTRLGPYEINSRIGAGGMGEVWQATDTRLGRSVAVKILPAAFGANAQLRTRFEREARTISQLNHPHICTLYDVGENYLVMELLEGETLADRLSRGPLPLAEALRYGAQIADALDKAHRSGVVHRDLKPGNVMLTKSGAKLLDFGLAKASAIDVNIDGATEHRPLTQEGTILGTFQYMSPEQLEGQDVDHRSDIFALGALLYEMLTARRAFEGKTKTSLIAAIVTAEPQALSQLQPLTPPVLEHVIRKCLAKDPEARWQSAHDIAEELRWIGEAGSQAGVAAPVAGHRRVQRRTLIAAAVAGWLLLLVAAFAGWRLWKRAELAQQPLRAELTVPGDVIVGLVNQGAAVLSPDGRKLAFLGGTAGSQLWIRDLGTGETAPLAGTDGALFPFWSPDATSLGFFASGKLKIIRATGGAVQALANATAGRGGAWSPDGVIVYAPDVDSHLMKVSVSGGAAAPLTKTTSDNESHRNPHFLSDGERFLYTLRKETMASCNVVAASLRGGLHRVVVENASNPAVYDGRIVYYRGGNVVAQEFDEASLTASGPPQVVAQGVEYFNARDIANFSVSRNGLFSYRSASGANSRPLWVGRDGRVIGPAVADGQFRVARATNDGTRVLLIKSDPAAGGEDVWIHDVARGATTRATFVAAGLVSATFSPDGTKLAVATSLSGAPASVWIQSVTGPSSRQELYRGDESLIVHDWAPDGRTILATTQRNRSGFDIVGMDASTGKVTPLLTGDYDENTPAISPDGRWLAYVSNESGRPEVYVTNLPVPSTKWQVSADGAGGALWSQDGGELLFMSRRKVWSVRVRRNAAAVEFDPPQQLPIEVPNATAPRSVTPDGRFLIVQREPVRTPFTLITNWTRTLPK